MVALAVLAAALPSFASAASHWKASWAEADYGDVDYYVDSGLPAPFNTSTAKSEMGNSRQTWNGVSGAPVLVDYGGTLSMSGVACASSGVGSVPNGRVYVKACNISAVGVIYIVHDGAQSHKALIIMDTQPSGFTWHISSSTTVPSDKVDLRGAVAHELGHSLGAYDPANNTQLHINLDCFSGSIAQTMCPSHLESTSQYRSAQSHEASDFVDANS